MISGVGIGLRSQHAEALLLTERQVDWLEITPENWLFHGGQRERTLAAVAERWPIVSHSVSLSVGGLDDFPSELLGALGALHRRTQAPFFSDHLCYSSIGGQPLHELLPLPFALDVVPHVARRMRALAERMERPFAIENATFYAVMPGSHMSEAAFLNAVLGESDGRLLLDVNNVYVNAKNHGLDARACIDQMPMQRVVELHLAGHTLQGDVIIDTHIGPIIDDVWSLYAYTLRRAGRMIPTLIEWDQDIPALDVLLDEVDRARACAARALGGGK